MTLPEIDALVAKLRTELPSADFDKLVLAGMGMVRGIEGLFKDRTLPLREAWIANEFGRVAGASHIQLAPSATARIDFWVVRDGVQTGFDATVAMDPNRDPIEEAWLAKQSDKNYSEETDAEMAYQEELALDRIGRRLRAKARKRDQRRLVVYINTGWLPDDDEFLSGIEALHQKYRSSFEEAYLLMKPGLIQIAPTLSELSDWRAG